MIPLTGLSPPHSCACPKTGPGIPRSYVEVFFSVFSERGLKVIVRFVGIGEIIDHRSLSSPLIIYLYNTLHYTFNTILYQCP